jgi:hypothetical protein
LASIGLSTNLLKAIPAVLAETKATKIQNIFSQDGNPFSIINTADSPKGMAKIVWENFTNSKYVLILFITCLQNLVMKFIINYKLYLK